MGYTRQTAKQTYEQPALQEAVITLFLSQRQHDPTLAGRLQARFSDLLTKHQTVYNPFWLGIQTPESGEPHPLVRLMNEVENFFVQYGTGILSFHSLMPYQGFTSFRDLALKITTFVLDSGEMSTVDDCSFLYYNQFDFAEESVILDDYFTVGLSLPPLPSAPSGIRSFNVSTEFEYEPIDRTVQLDYRSGAEGGVRLRLECRPENSPPRSVSEISEWLDVSHNLLADIFESSITEKARVVMGRRK